MSAARQTTVAQRLRTSRDSSWRQRAIATSPFFDAGWYLGRYGDIRRAGVDPLEHYFAHGESEDRDPGPEFDVDAYVWMNPGARGQALTHYHRTLHAASLTPDDLRPNQVIDVNLPALTLGWLDESWYTHAHPGASATELNGLHPWVHHRRTGLDPSPVFDNAEYHSQMSTAEQHEEPVLHWLRADEHAALRPQVVSRPAPLHPPYRPLVQHRVRPPAALADLDVAVMIHAFYPDLLQPLLVPVRHITAATTLLVSVVEPNDAAAAHRMIDDVLGAAQPRVVKIVPNRGRNFAPLLCSFRDEVRQHEFLLHLHTKKSLYSGTEQTDWRTHLVTSLLPSSAGVDAILSLLADDASVGVVQAPTWSSFPHWGNHWLGNRSTGAALYERLGVRDRIAHGYLSYPVGGMFWAKTAALEPLLDLDITAGDFDREHGQTDRTLAHAIERTIPAAASVAGFDTVEFDAIAAQWRRNWTQSNVPDFGAIDSAALDLALDAADLVTVDLFDTLLLRPALEPDVLFDVLAMQLTARSADDTETGSVSVDGPGLVAIRRAAEHDLRVNYTIAGDVSLDEIYAAAITEHAEDTAHLLLLKRLELDLERRIAIPRTWLIERLLADRSRQTDAGQKPRRYVLMTDTTQPSPAIEALLTQIGAADLFDDLYVSNACRARKDTGTMWSMARELEAPAPGRWLHLGDNEFSDIQQASDRGVSWFHVPAPAAIAQFGGVDSALLPDETRAGTQLVAGHGLASLASHPIGGTDDQGSVDAFGYGVLGPLTLTFVAWMLQTAREQRIDRLLFTARDGHLALDLFNRIRVFLPADAPRADYFYMSRRMALGMLQHDGDHLAHICDAGDFSGRLGDMLKARIGLTLRGPDGDRVSQTEIVLPTDTALVVDALTPFLPEIVEHGTTELQAFHAYLRHLDVTPDEHLGLVDLGYSGTTQKALNELIAQKISGLYYVTTARANDLGDAAHSCFGTDVTLGGHNLIYDKALTFELVCSAEHPQVERFEHDQRGLRVVFNPRTASAPSDRRRVEIAQDAAIRFVRDHIERFGVEVLDLPIDPATVISSIERCMGTLVPEVNDIFAGSVIDDFFCGRGEQSVTGTAARPSDRDRSTRPA